MKGATVAGDVQVVITASAEGELSGSAYIVLDRCCPFLAEAKEPGTTEPEPEHEVDACYRACSIHGAYWPVHRPSTLFHASEEQPHPQLCQLSVGHTSRSLLHVLSVFTALHVPPMQ